MFLEDVLRENGRVDYKDSIGRVFHLSKAEECENGASLRVPVTRGNVKVGSLLIKNVR